MTTFLNAHRPQLPAAALPPLTTARAGALFLDDRGAATAEYAIATMAVVAQKWHTLYMERVAFYARQSVHEDQGIAQQLASMRKRATGEDWTIVEEYVDNFTSATKTRGDGTEWARMLSDVDAGKIDTIVAVKSARLLRRVEDALEVTAPRRDVRVVTFDGIDTSNHWGRVILLIMTSIAEAEIEEKEARAIPYRAARREAGHPVAGLVPYGYRWVPDLQRDDRGTRYEVVPEEAAVLRFMSRRLLVERDSLAQIVRDLNDGTATDENGNLLPPSSRHPRPRRDKATGELVYSPWITSTVRRLLVSPFQAALLPPPMPEGVKYRADRFTLSHCAPGAWEPILTADQVNAARGRLLDSSRLFHDGDTKAKWLLAGLGVCGKCGGPTRSTQSRTTARRVRAIRCTAGCFVRPAAPIEEYVVHTVVNVLGTPGLLTWVDDGGADIDSLRTRREALAAERAEAEGLYRSRKLSAPTFSDMVDEIDAALAQTDGDLADALRADPLAEFVSVDDVHGLWDSISTNRRRVVLAALLHAIEIRPVGKGRRILTMDDTESTVTMRWREVEHRVSLATGHTTHTVKVPGDAHEAISGALSTP